VLGFVLLSSFGGSFKAESRKQKFKSKPPYIGSYKILKEAHWKGSFNTVGAGVRRLTLEFLLAACCFEVRASLRRLLQF
jgi:hypothetical protein